MNETKKPRPPWSAERRADHSRKMQAFHAQHRQHRAIYAYSLRIPLDLAELLKASAEKNRRSFASETLFALSLYLKTEKPR